MLTYAAPWSTQKDGQGTKAAVIKSLIKTEEQRELYRRLKIISGKLGENMSTTSVVVKNNDGSVTELVSKKKMERAIMAKTLGSITKQRKLAHFYKNH